MRLANLGVVRVGRAQRYERLGALASGGMGTVYLGRMTAGDTSQTVAMKVMHPHLADNSDMVAMFLDEARVATRLRHPNVVGVLDMDMLGDELVIVMEYVEGITLGSMQSALRQGGRQLPIGVAVRILHDALAGLHEVHELLDENGAPLGLVHRDVSPHNLLVGSDGVTRVTDFGVALAAGRLATTRPDGTLKGKLQYLAPEQVGRKPIDRRVDIFAAGIVLWECLTFGATGQRLFEAPTEAETVTRVLRDPIAPPSMTRTEVSLELDEVCLKALERDPERRFKTAAEFAEALRLAFGPLPDASEVGALVLELAAKPIREQRESLVRATRGAAPRRASQRRRQFVGVSAGAIVLGVLGGGAILLAQAAKRPSAHAAPSEPSVSPSPSASPLAAAVPPVPTSAPSSAASIALAATSADPPAPEPPAAKERSSAIRGPAPRAVPSAKHSKAARPFMPDDL